MKTMIAVLTLIFLSACSVVSTRPTEMLSASSTKVQVQDKNRSASAQGWNPKAQKGDFRVSAFAQCGPVKCFAGIQGSGKGGQKHDPSVAVDHASVQNQTVGRGIDALQDMSRKFPGMLP